MSELSAEQFAHRAFDVNLLDERQLDAPTWEPADAFTNSVPKLYSLMFIMPLVPADHPIGVDVGEPDTHDEGVRSWKHP